MSDLPTVTRTDVIRAMEHCIDWQRSLRDSDDAAAQAWLESWQEWGNADE